MRILRNLDLLVLGVALPVWIATGLPILGWAAATGAWLLSRALQAFTERRGARSANRRVAMGMRAASLVGRLYLVGLTVLGAGIIERKAGLSAGVLAAATFTVWFVSLLIGGAIQEGEE
jgi:hypothetical protein